MKYIVVFVICSFFLCSCASLYDSRRQNTYKFHEEEVTVEVSRKVELSSVKSSNNGLAAPIKEGHFKFCGRHIENGGVNMTKTDEFINLDVFGEVVDMEEGDFLLAGVLKRNFREVLDQKFSRKRRTAMFELLDGGTEQRGTQAHEMKELVLLIAKDVYLHQEAFKVAQSIGENEVAGILQKKISEIARRANSQFGNVFNY